MGMSLSEWGLRPEEEKDSSQGRSSGSESEEDIKAPAICSIFRGMEVEAAERMNYLNFWSFPTQGMFS